MYPIIKSCCQCLAQNVLRSQLPKTNKIYLPSVTQHVQRYSSNKDTDDNSTVSSSFEKFKNTSSTIIFDVDEERQLAKENPNYRQLYQKPEDAIDEFEGLNLERGITGVYDIEDLVAVLNKEKAKDVCVISIPPTCRYTDFIVIVTGKSYKHMLAIATFVRRVFKKKYDPERGDRPPKIEGEESNDWIAMDLGNIALHVFSSKAREKYDLESLWCLGRDLDFRSNEEQDLISMLESHSFSLDDLKPMDEAEENELTEEKK
uniref:Mitochondrial assembly of ribosomal large subunit protein 1 n=1 Tax=Cacopsylla melanoneura TaxID=428564 RepID=A0A8D9ETQ0_9HEMI